MKFTVDVTILKSLVEDLAAISDSKDTKHLIFSQIKVDCQQNSTVFTAFNFEMSMTKEIETNTERPGMCTLPAKSLLELLKAFPNKGNVTLSMTDDKRVRISQSRSRFNLSSMDPFAFPSMPSFGKEVGILSSKAFVEAISTVSNSMSTDADVRPFLCATMLEPAEEAGFMRAVSSDGYRLTTCKVPGVLIEPILIAKNIITTMKKIVAKYEEFSYSFDVSNNTATSMICRFKDAVLSVRLMAPKFPNYRTMLPRGNFAELIFNREELLGSLKRILLFADKNSEHMTIHMSAGKANVKLAAMSNAGEGEDEIILKDKSSIPGDMQVSFNGGYLEKMVSAFKGENLSVRVYTEISPVVFLDGTNIMGIVMPVKNK